LWVNRSAEYALVRCSTIALSEVIEEEARLPGNVPGVYPASLLSLRQTRPPG